MRHPHLIEHLFTTKLETSEDSQFRRCDPVSARQRHNRHAKLCPVNANRLAWGFDSRYGEAVPTNSSSTEPSNPPQLPNLEISDEVIARYRSVFSIPTHVPVTEDMIWQHVNLEYKLTGILLQSTPDERSTVWAESYDQLYGELPWLAQYSGGDESVTNLQYSYLLKIIPEGTKSIEIGSGSGRLARYLTRNNRPCIATEITPKRGERADREIEWHATDGIHLTDYEGPATYSSAISMQVIEHFHPDDVYQHFQSMFELLKPNGRYILTTPHAFLGPADLSTVFRLERPYFMHLKEYTHRELGDIARKVGFRTVAAVYIPPTAVRKNFDVKIYSRLLYRYLRMMERLIGQSRPPHLLLRALLFRGDVFLVVTK